MLQNSECNCFYSQAIIIIIIIIISSSSSSSSSNSSSNSKNYCSVLGYDNWLHVIRFVLWGGRCVCVGVGVDPESYGSRSHTYE